MANYCNPPETVPVQGRLLSPGSFDKLVAQLAQDELLFAYYHVTGKSWYAAPHLETQDIYDDVMRDHRPWRFYAVPKQAANPNLYYPVA